MSTFKYDALEVVFSTPNSKNSPAQSNTASTEQEENPLDSPIIFKESPVEPKVEDKWDKIEELQISDPARYEEMIARGELPDDRDQEA